MNSMQTKTNPSKNEVLQSSNEAVSDYLQNISHFKVLSPLEEKVLAKKIVKGDEEAKKELVEANLKLVVNIAKKTIHISGIPLIDLIQEGNLGLMVAVEKFNYKLGYKFSTYASWWIKQAMFKAISEQSYPMKIPVYIQEALSKFSKVKSKMEQKYNCSVKNHDVAKEINISPEKIDTFLNAYTKSLSLESSKDEHSEGLCLYEIIEDTKQIPEGDIEYENLRKDLDEALKILQGRERDVLTMRFGLGETKKRTLEDIGSIWGVTKECIRQTEKRALGKIKNSLVCQELLECYVL